MRRIAVTDTFKDDLKNIRQRGWNENLLWKAVKLIQRGIKLPYKYYDHPLKAKYIGYRDCHIETDWVLIYKNEKERLILVRTGSHSDLFEKNI